MDHPKADMYRSIIVEKPERFILFYIGASAEGGILDAVREGDGRLMSCKTLALAQTEAETILREKIGGRIEIIDTKTGDVTVVVNALLNILTNEVTGFHPS